MPYHSRPPRFGSDNPKPSSKYGTTQPIRLTRWLDYLDKRNHAYDLGQLSHLILHSNALQICSDYPTAFLNFESGHILVGEKLLLATYKEGIPQEFLKLDHRDFEGRLQEELPFPIAHSIMHEIAHYLHFYLLTKPQGLDLSKITKERIVDDTEYLLNIFLEIDEQTLHDEIMYAERELAFEISRTKTPLAKYPHFNVLLNLHSLLSIKKFNETLEKGMDRRQAEESSYEGLMFQHDNLSDKKAELSELFADLFLLTKLPKYTPHSSQLQYLLNQIFYWVEQRSSSPDFTYEFIMDISDYDLYL